MAGFANTPRCFADTLARLEREQVLSRLWAHDHTIWREDPTEISNRLGWLHLPETMPKQLDEIARFVEDVRDEGIEDVLLLGMGGSSLAPDTFSLTFGSAEGHPSLRVLDSTHPDAIRRVEESLDPDRTLVIVATKSGTTTETLSFFRYMWHRLGETVAPDSLGRHFVAITDPGSPLVPLAESLRFRRVFENDPNLGGRYSALSHFGLVPAALLGVDVQALLEQARAVARLCAQEATLSENPAVALGAFLGAAAQEGRDKATFLVSEGVSSFANWVEQLIAESTGKDGVGILPVVDEPPGPPTAYGEDRVFVRLRLAEDASLSEASTEGLERAGHPVAWIDLPDLLALGGQFFLWELATAVAGQLLHINPFDQPNVEAAKRLARRMVDRYEETGSLPESPEEKPSADAVARLLDGASAGAYAALQAYIPPTGEAREALGSLRRAIRDSHLLATTAGFGPRYLHSTGQLHKGDGGRGLFIQFKSDPQQDLPIPDDVSSSKASITFGTLIAAQAAGDRHALIDAGRRVLTLRLAPGDEAEQIDWLAEGLS